jgi:protein-disulfide isomerase
MPPVPKPRTAKDGRNRTLLIALGAAAVVAAALIVGSIVLTGGGSSSSSSPETTTTAAGAKPAALALIAGIPQNGTILGKPSAQVRMLQYEDLQCPICKRYTDDVFPAIVNEYVKPGRLQLDFRGLAFLGADSEKAMRVALAAGKQNRLWDVVGLFYANQGEENSGWVTNAKIDEILGQVPGLDVAKVKKDAQSAAITQQLEQLSAEATQNGVQGTPSFFIARGVNQPFPVQITSLTPDAFRSVLNEALQG